MPTPGSCRIDTSEAEKHPGVLAMITSNDFPGAEDKIEELGETATNLQDALDNILAI